MFRWVVGLILVLYAGPAGAEGISVSQSIDRADVAFEGKVNFEIRLEWQGGQSAYLFDKPLDPDIENFRVGRFSSAISSTGDPLETVTTKTFKYTLIPISSGIGRINPVTIDYVSWPDSIPGVLVTEALLVNIARPVEIEQSDNNSVITLVIVAVVLLGIFVGGFIRYRRKKPVEILKSPVQILLDGLTVLKKDAGSDLKKFQFGIFELIIEFLSANYGVKLKSFTEDALNSALEKTGLNDYEREKISSYLLKAQADKFMPVSSAPGDTNRLESELRDFFEKMKK